MYVVITWIRASHCLYPFACCLPTSHFRWFAVACMCLPTVRDRDLELVQHLHFCQGPPVKSQSAPTPPNSFTLSKKLLILRKVHIISPEAWRPCQLIYDEETIVCTATSLDVPAFHLCHQARWILGSTFLIVTKVENLACGWEMYRVTVCAFYILWLDLSIKIFSFGNLTFIFLFCFLRKN